MLSDDDIAALVKDFYATILQQDDTQRLLADEPDAFQEHRAEYYRQLAERSRIDLASNAFGSVRQITAVMLARRYGMETTFDKLSVRKAGQAMLRAGVEVAESLRARAEGDFNYEPRDKLLIAALAAVAPHAPGTAQAPAFSAPAEPPSGPLFSVEADRFREAQVRRGEWEKQTALQARKSYALFLEHFGDRPLASFVRTDAAAFKQLLSDLPANYGKAAEFRGMLASEIIAATADQSIERLSPRTIQRHFNALAALWAMAVEQGHATTNIFAKWKFPSAKRARDQREHWSRDQLAGLFATPLWSGCQSLTRRSKPGDLIVRDAKFWLPLIAVFSGMRQEEICQLRLVDVRREEGVWVFDINNRDGQQLKNVNAVRRVPLHSELVRLGLLVHLNERQEAKDRMLFPDLNPGGADDRLGHNYSKWFSRYRQEADVYVFRRDFHSFRHTATTFMRQAGVDGPIVDEVTGHETAGETARYTKGFTIDNIKDAVETIEIGIDLSHLHLVNMP
ncbi:tyrosine-type recombinase/integrase [Sphingomonas sp. LR59]|uniref:site-specific integrase n=1 Tax=Sphingomonas sp. LR59 TaxID=3050232 RepID=UPI002FE25BEF